MSFLPYCFFGTFSHLDDIAYIPPPDFVPYIFFFSFGADYACLISHEL